MEVNVFSAGFVYLCFYNISFMECVAHFPGNWNNFIVALCQILQSDV